MTTKPLYVLIKLDVDPEVVFTYDDANKYVHNFCNRLEFQYVDHCYEDKENDDLFIGCDPAGNPLGKEEEPMFTLNEDDWL